MKTFKNFNFKNEKIKKVLVRCDFNVPLSEKGNILDDFRIKSTLPTIQYLIKEKARIILMSHLGRPKGKVVEGLRLAPIQKLLEKYLNLPLKKSEDCIGKETEELINKMESGEILLLENLRFHREEEENDNIFARKLAGLGDIYINDAFGASHRSHASIVGIPKYLPSGAGLLLEKEIGVLTNLMENPQKPLLAIIGGAKVETKTELINKISKITDFVLIGGLIKKEIEEKKIFLNCPKKIVAPFDEPEKRDIGEKTIKLFKEKILSAKTILFNGALGQIEKEEFTKGTEEILKAIIQSGAFSVVGGGEMVEFVNKLGLIEKFNHVSTGGGAMIAFLSGEKLPGIAALEKGEPRSI